MKWNFFNKSIALALVLSVLSSCSDLLDVQPKQSIDATTALTSSDAVLAAVNGMYDRLQNTALYGRDLLAMADALSDNGRATNKSGRLNGEYLNQPNAHFTAAGATLSLTANTTSTTNNVWGAAYFTINQANLILEALPTVAKMPQATKDRVEGEALFIRGLMYFELMRCHAYEPLVEIKSVSQGGVPLIKKGVTASTQVELLPRAPIAEVYASIVADLNGAIAKLTNARGVAFASKAAAQALMSRVALYQGDYANAAKFATDALAAGGIGTFVTRANYVAGWRATIHPESIFELSYQTNENVGVNTSLQTTYTTLVASGNRTTTGGFGDLVPTANLLAALDAPGVGVDIRRSMYELGTAGRGTAEIECTKFLGRSGQVNLDNIPVIRISEMYLNRAEANARLGREADALTDLNAIRVRAGLTASSATLTGTALVEEILNQRRLELAFEGHRWFDLKRLGRDIVKAAPATTIAFSDFRILAAIPTREVQANTNLKQNIGY